MYPSLASPVGKPDEYMNGGALSDMNAAFSTFGYAQPSGAYGGQPSLAGPVNMLGHSLSTTTDLLTNQFPGNLIVHHYLDKSRVETQIPITLLLLPQFAGPKKLHLQHYTISKPKLLTKAPQARSPDTLELYVTLVCTSAMQDESKRQKALARAALQPGIMSNGPPSPSSGGSSPDQDDPALNGGNVQICQGCITRERKRAARKKSKKPEEDEMWLKDEAKRIIVFNTSEHKDWQEAPASFELVTEAESENMDPPEKKRINTNLPKGTMMVELPMRIACYCRHHQEKLGFTAIMTIKDHRDNLVAQGLSRNIMITDDHKTHIPSVPVGSSTSLYSENSPDQLAGVGFLGDQQMGNYGLARNAHSTNDLQNLQNGYAIGFPAQNFAPYAMPQQMSQPNSTATTPHTLSRQASPSAHTAPNAKRRKASGGSVKIPEKLTMTKLQTGKSNFTNASNAAFASTNSAMPDTSATTSPFNSCRPTLNGLPERPIARHRPQRSAQFSAGPSTPVHANQDMFDFHNRSQSLENLALLRNVPSAPSSARQSRAPSPTNINQFTQFASVVVQPNPYHVASSTSGLATSRRVPTITRVIPNEGPKAGGSEVTCLGSGLSGNVQICFGDAQATKTASWGDSCIVCLSPPATGAGEVVVHVRPHPQANGLQGGFHPSMMPKHQPLFRYYDDDEQQLINQAMAVLSQKQDGRASNLRDFARGVLGQSNGAQNHFTRGSNQGHGQYYCINGPDSGKLFDAESAALKCLDLIDLDDSSFPAQYNLRRPNGQTLLHIAASLGFQQLVAALLARSVHPDTRDCNGMSPMHMAALNDRPQIVRRLRLAGADPSLRSLGGFTPADMARSQAVRREVLTDLSARPRTAPLAYRGRSLPGSSASLVSLKLPAQKSLREMNASTRNALKAEDNTSLSRTSSPIRGAPTPVRSRRNSISQESDLDAPQMQDNGFFRSAAAMAWRDHFASQIQSLQPNMNWTLPNLPTLPPLPSLSDYQAYHMYRLLSSLVPQRNSFSSFSGPLSPDAKTTTGPEYFEESSAPPAYEDIYPSNHQDSADVKLASAIQTAAEAKENRKCGMTPDAPGTKAMSTSDSGRCPPEASSTCFEQDDDKALQDFVKVKRLRSDSRLFFIWVSIVASKSTPS